jgi:hypothetical protein
MLPSPATEHRKSENLALRPSANAWRSPAQSGIGAREPLTQRKRQRGPPNRHLETPQPRQGRRRRDRHRRDRRGKVPHRPHQRHAAPPDILGKLGAGDNSGCGGPFVHSGSGAGSGFKSNVVYAVDGSRVAVLLLNGTRSATAFARSSAAANSLYCAA